MIALGSLGSSIFRMPAWETHIWAEKVSANSEEAETDGEKETGREGRRQKTRDAREKKIKEWK